jgi:tetratricopeptide (TPR) repeat protein
MRVEADSARRDVSRPAAAIALACVLALAGFAYPEYAAVTAAYGAPHVRAPRDGAATIALEEQSLPPEDLSSPAASPAASPAPQSGAQPPAAPGATLAPGAQTSPQANDEGTGGESSEWTRMPAGVGTAAGSGSASSAAGATVSPTAAVGAPVAGEPVPQATPTEAPPPYDVGSIQPTAPVSDQPLNGLIASTQGQPALNASLHFAEDGRKALETSKLDDAIRDFGRAISIDPTDPYAYFYLGRAYMLKKDYTQALAFFGRSEVGLRAVPAWYGEVKSFEGACLEEQGKFPQAATAYKQALDAAPGNLMAHAGYGRLSENLSDANAGNTPAPPPPADGAALPAPDVNLAAPAPAEAAPPPADSDQSDSGADTDDDSSADSTGSGPNSGPNQAVTH